MCRGGQVNLLNGTAYSVRVYFRASRPAEAAVLVGVPGAGAVVATAPVGRVWVALSADLAPAQRAAGGVLHLRVRAPPAASVWFDDAFVAVNASRGLLV